MEFNLNQQAVDIVDGDDSVDPAESQEKYHSSRDADEIAAVRMSARTSPPTVGHCDKHEDTEYVVDSSSRNSSQEEFLKFDKEQAEKERVVLVRWLQRLEVKPDRPRPRPVFDEPDAPSSSAEYDGDGLCAYDIEDDNETEDSIPTAALPKPSPYDAPPYIAAAILARQENAGERRLRAMEKPPVIQRDPRRHPNFVEKEQMRKETFKQMKRQELMYRAEMLAKSYLDDEPAGTGAAATAAISKSADDKTSKRSAYIIKGEAVAKESIMKARVASFGGNVKRAREVPLSKTERSLLASPLAQPLVEMHGYQPLKGAGSKVSAKEKDAGTFSVRRKET
jgi:hypothetical protein